ncbi:tripartite-type tricarboxylate transporter receptor subunit TctC [Humitalea rosea]|uniref:Tripartite-type tricarboxylate transporter receptor subunit TctC n=1 Tax=Humitalea rosea TaxID=990373 RepID=A0A2W7KJH3_9PROT|nr:tripartite tricarboxylate transporter substrate-binding protein [Humitalea rosea]PZW48096.1 tripartite-type tricarboxylate transporter receptor subunit TctC [Humitalea rosea]
MTLPILRRAAIQAGAAGLLGAVGARASRASDIAWPSQAIRLVVPYTPGGSNDAVARPIAEKLQDVFGRTVVVENRPGATGAIGAAVVANAPADGHTLLLASSSFATASTMRRTTFDAIESFDPVASICDAPMLVVTKPGGFTDIRALVAFAKANPGRLQYGMAGMGGIGYFTQELFNRTAELRMEAIPYSGIGPASIDLVAGRIDFLMTTLASVRGLVEAGTVKVIAVSSPTRAPAMPDVPTIKEVLGVDFGVNVWWGILAPRGIPAGVRERLNVEITRAAASDSYTRFLAADGAKPAPSSVAEFSQMVREDILRWRHLANEVGIQAN